MSEPAPQNDSPSPRRYGAAKWGVWLLGIMLLLCFGTLPWTLEAYDTQALELTYQSPSLSPLKTTDQSVSLSATHGWLGTDNLGRSLLSRLLLGGAISLGIGLAGALIAVTIGTTWGLVSGYAGGRIDAVMMRLVDILYGLPYILLVILLAVGVDGAVNRYRQSEMTRLKTPQAQEAKAKYDQLVQQIDALTASIQQLAASPETAKEIVEQKKRLATLRRSAKATDPRSGFYRFIENYPDVINLLTLLVAIGSISWLTLARVVRGQVLSLKAQPFIESARATGCGTLRILGRHLLPNLAGPIIVYTTLTVPQTILQESFLSFLGIGVQLPLPSWGNLAAKGLEELNTVQTHLWLLIGPCVLLGLTLLALNFVGDGLRDRWDPHRH